MTVLYSKLSSKLISLLPPPSCSLSFCVHLLVGADSLSEDLIRETLFHYAKEDNIFVVQLLFKLKISPNLIDSNGTTAFHHNVSTIQMLKLFHQGMKFYFEFRGQKRLILYFFLNGYSEKDHLSNILEHGKKPI